VAKHHLLVFWEGYVMLRSFLAAALVSLSTAAFAQHVEADKGLKFGAECVGPVTRLAPRLGTCMIVGAKTRIWCPNRRVFDVMGDKPQSYLVRSICELNQVL
jgi:hypothetical protein